MKQNNKAHVAVDTVPLSLNPVGHACNDTIKVQFLEHKTSNLENQLLLLSSKVDSLLTSFISFSKHSTNQQISTIYSCELCNYEAEDISVLKTHKETNHQKFVSCHKCDFKSKELDDLKAHKSD